MSLLRIEEIDVFHGASQALYGFSASLSPGEILCLMGRNGAGKTTALRAVMGTLPLASGRVRLGDQVISDLPAHRVPGLGLAHVPQGRRLFAELSVRENLEIGQQVQPAAGRADALAFALDLFPVLKERMAQRSGTLSGGEQTMLSVARAICAGPRVMLLDEPTEGLMPAAVQTIRAALLRLKAGGMAVLLVEQRAEAVLGMADRVLFLDHGRVRDDVPIAALRADPGLMRRHVGIGTAPPVASGQS